MATMFLAGKSALLEFWEAFDEMNIFLKLLACAALVIVSHLVVALLYGLISTICDKIREKAESKRPPRPSAMKLLETSQETFVDAQVRVNCQLKPGKVFPIKVRFMRGKNNEWIALHSTLNGRDCLRDCSVKCSRCQGALHAMLSHDIGLLEKEPITLYDLDSSTGYIDYVNKSSYNNTHK